MKKIIKKQSDDIDKMEEKIIKSINNKNHWDKLKGKKLNEIISMLDQAAKEPLYLRKAAINKTHSI